MEFNNQNKPFESKTVHFDSMFQKKTIATTVRIRPNPPVRPNPAAPARPSESGRTQIVHGRPNPAELRFWTAVRIRPNSDWGRPPESGRTTHKKTWPKSEFWSNFACFGFKIVFLEEISRWFWMVLPGEAQKTYFFYRKPPYLIKNLKNTSEVPEIA